MVCFLNKQAWHNLAWLGKDNITHIRHDFLCRDSYELISLVKLGARFKTFPFFAKLDAHRSPPLPIRRRFGGLRSTESAE
jgi:hypothetical protein